jgi:hypothetical protein
VALEAILLKNRPHILGKTDRILTATASNHQRYQAKHDQLAGSLVKNFHEPLLDLI